jgi:acyl homoserine lactone synthase
MLLLDESRPIAFQEDTFTVRTLAGDRDLRASYALRHQVFAQRLHWVEPSPDGIEVDAYDAFATSVGLFDEEETLVGVFRMVRSSYPFMLEKEFRACLPDGCDIRKADDTAEITRLALDPTLTDKGLSSRLLLVLIKGVYQWARQNEVRYMYMVVEKRFLRVLRGIGLSCEAISPAVSLPPAGAQSVAAILDWQRFAESAQVNRPLFFLWMNGLDGSLAFEKSGFLPRDPRERCTASGAAKTRVPEPGSVNKPEHTCAAA